MNTELLIDLSREHYVPGSTVSGEILWALEKDPGVVRLTLGWWTEGRGSKDAKIEASREWSTSEIAGREPFSFELPPSPYSFSGTLISLVWGLELSIKKGKAESLRKITVSPGETPPVLPHIDEGRRKTLFLGRRGATGGVVADRDR